MYCRSVTVRAASGIMLRQTPGPYAPSSSVDVDVILTNREGQAIQPRLITLDFSATDPALGLPATFHFQLVPPLIVDALYSRFETLPKVDIVYTGSDPVPGFILDIPDGAQFVLGTITVGLPPSNGSFLLDLFNPGAPAQNRAAVEVDARDSLDIQPNGVPCRIETVRTKPAKSVVHADDLEALVDGFDSGGADHGVDAGCRPTAHQNAQPLPIHDQ